MALKSVRGMHDLFGENAITYDYIIETGKKIAALHGFETIYTPIVEFSDLFERNLGEESDIVSKEIYKFADKGNNILALRPEFTASVIRSFSQHGMYVSAMPKRLFSYGQVFRYDRPQAGRYRQFNQLNFEIIGIKNFVIDTECLITGFNLLNSLNISDFILNINFLGSYKTRTLYETKLIDFLKTYEHLLSEDGKKKLQTSPLRIFDSKNISDIEILKNAPLLSECYDKEDTDHFEKIKSLLNELKFNFIINEKLVRGLDYYTGIVFEFITKDGLTIIGGGRYDNLIKDISEKISMPSIGFAVGIERLMALVQKNEIEKNKIGIIYCSENEVNFSFYVADFLRKQNNSVIIIYGTENIGKKITKADQLLCTHICICGSDEKNSKTIKLKNLKTKEEYRIVIN